MIIPFLFLTDPVLLFWILVFAFQAFILLDLPVVHLNALWKDIVLSSPAKITVPSGNPVQYERGNLSATQTIRYVDRAKTRWPWWKHFDGIHLFASSVKDIFNYERMITLMQQINFLKQVWIARTLIIHISLEHNVSGHNIWVRALVVPVLPVAMTRFFSILWRYNT